MQHLGERLREAVGEGLGHDVGVVVLRVLVLLHELLHADACGVDEEAEVVLDARVLRRNEV